MEERVLVIRWMMEAFEDDVDLFCQSRELC